MQYQPPEDLKRFLAAGSRPVYVGFGSMTLSKAKVPCQDCFARSPAIPVMSCIGFSPASIAHIEQAQCAARFYASRCKESAAG